MSTVLIGNAPYLERILPSVGYLSAWETPEAFTKHIASLNREKCWDSSGWDKNKDFHGTESMGEAMDLATNGWKEGKEKIFTMRESIQANSPSAPRPIKFGIAGAYPDVPRAIAGNPLNMRVIDLGKSKRRPVLTLVYNMCSSWSTEANAISRAAAAVAALIDQVESAGYSCEVIASAISEGNGHVITAVIVKNAGQHVDVERLAFFMGHASMFRRFIFADWGHHGANKHLGRSLGSVMAFDPREEDRLKNVFYIPSIQTMRAEFSTDELAMKQGLPIMVANLKAQGCPAFTDKLELKKAA